MPDQKHIVIVGAGTGAYVAAIRAAQLGAKTAIVEKQYLGGTCLNVGCIPSKAMLHIAEVLHNMSSLSEFGIGLPQQPTFDMKQAVAFKDKVVKRMTGGVGTLMKGNGVDVFDGLGTIDASRNVRPSNPRRPWRALSAINAGGEECRCGRTSAS